MGSRWLWPMAAAVALSLWLASGAVGADGPANVSAAPVDFGTVPQGLNVRRTVTLRNANGEVLRIVKAQTSCACLKVVGFPAAIPARGAAEAELLIETLTLTGKHGKQAFFTCEGAAQGLLAVETTVEVQAVPAQLLVTPETAHCGTVWSDQEVRREVTVTNLGKVPLDIRSLSCDVAGVTAQWAGDNQRVPAGETGKLTIMVTGKQLKPGPLQADVRLATNLPLHAVVLVPVRGTVVARAPAKGAERAPAGGDGNTPAGAGPAMVEPAKP